MEGARHIGVITTRTVVGAVILAVVAGCASTPRGTPRARAWMAVGCADGGMYVHDGTQLRSNVPFPLGDAWYVDFTSGEWTALGDPPVDDLGMAGAWTGSEFLVVGGARQVGTIEEADGSSRPDIAYHYEAVAYSPSLARWRAFPPVVEGSGEVTVTVDGGGTSLVAPIGGGRLESSATYRDGRWRRVPPPPNGAAVVGLDRGFLAVVGDRVWTASPTVDAWTPWGSLPTDLGVFPAAARSGTVVLVVGETGAVRMDLAAGSVEPVAPPRVDEIDAILAGSDRFVVVDLGAGVVGLSAAGEIAWGTIPAPVSNLAGSGVCLDADRIVVFGGDDMTHPGDISSVDRTWTVTLPPPSS